MHMSLPSDTKSVPHCPNCDALAKALETIERWFGEFPPSGRTWPDGRPMSWGSAFGSNGERDFMRAVARKALAKHREAKPLTSSPAPRGEGE